MTSPEDAPEPRDEPQIEYHIAFHPESHVAPEGAQQPNSSVYAKLVAGAPRVVAGAKPANGNPGADK